MCHAVWISSNCHQAVYVLCEHRVLCYRKYYDHMHRHICNFIMGCKLEQRVNITFCIKLCTSATVYGNEAMSRVRCFKWQTCFKSIRTSLDDDKRSGRPSTSLTPENVETIQWLVHKDRQRSINDLVVIIDLSYGTVQAILKSYLNMHCIAAEFVPRFLLPFLPPPDQKELCAERYQNLHQRALDDPTFMSSMTWRSNNSLCSGKSLHFHDRRRRHTSAVWPRACSSFSSTFAGLFTWIHPWGPHFLWQVLLQSSEASEDIWRKQIDLWYEDNWMLHEWQRTLSPSSCNTWVSWLWQHGDPIAPALLTRFGPLRLLFFLKMKLQLRGCHFDTVEEIQCESQKVLDTLGEQDFENASQQWQRHWECCIAAQRDYFEVLKLESSEYFLVYRPSLGTLWYHLVTSSGTVFVSRKEVFHLTTHSTHFIYGYLVSFVSRYRFVTNRKYLKIFCE